MKNFLGMIFGSASASALNLIAITMAATRINLQDLDVYFISRDAAESILKLLFISQVGLISIAVIRTCNGELKPVKRILVVGGFISAVTLATWTLAFPHFSQYFFPTQSDIKIGITSHVPTFVAIFCFFSWLDSIASMLLIHLRMFKANHIGNFICAATTCLIIVAPSKLNVGIMATAFAIGKAAGTIPKIALCLKIKQHKVKHFSENGSGSYNIIKLALPYVIPNILQQVNRYSYLAGVAFLSSGFYAVFCLFYRYYSALQNLITVNLLNLSTSKLSETKTHDSELIALIQRHVQTFLILFASCSLFMLIGLIPVFHKHLPSFMLSSATPLIWSTTLLNFLPDGLIFIISRRDIIYSNKWDSHLNTAQTLTNITALYPSMKLFGIAGLAYATLSVCVVFSAIRLVMLSKTVPEIKSMIYTISIYGISLLSITIFQSKSADWFFYLTFFIISICALIHFNFYKSTSISNNNSV